MAGFAVLILPVDVVMLSVKYNLCDRSRFLCKFTSNFPLTFNNLMDLGVYYIQYTMIESNDGPSIIILSKIRTFVFSFSIPGHVTFIILMRWFSWALKVLSSISNFYCNL